MDEGADGRHGASPRGEGHGSCRQARRLLQRLQGTGASRMADSHGACRKVHSWQCAEIGVHLKELVLLSALVSDAEPEAAALLSLADASAVAAADESASAALEDTELSSCVAAATSSTPVPSSVVADVTEGRASIHARSTESAKASALFPVMRAFALPWPLPCHGAPSAVCGSCPPRRVHPFRLRETKIPLTRAYEALAHGHAAISGGPSPLPQNCSIPMLGRMAGQRSSANSASFLMALPEPFPTIWVGSSSFDTC